MVYWQKQMKYKYILQCSNAVHEFNLGLIFIQELLSLLPSILKIYKHLDLFLFFSEISNTE